jgi:hypothetical protein
MKNMMKKMIILVIAVSAGQAEARQSVSPYVIHSPYIIQSNVTITLNPVITGPAPRSFNYKLTHLGQMMAQGSIALTPSHHSLIAAGGMYNAAEINVCNTITPLYPTPTGVPIRIERKNYYFIPPNTTQLISQTLTDC